MFEYLCNGIQKQGEVKMENQKAVDEKLPEIKEKTKTHQKNTPKLLEENSEEQGKFFINVSKSHEQKAVIHQYLREANKKSFGRKVSLKDLVLFALPKLSAKDIEKIQEGTITEDERIEKIENVCREFNEKNGTSLTVGEFVLKKLNIL